METVEAAPTSLGPRYAPEDPALPKPWKGLIDGSTKLLYYWNPETNVTQYERPSPSAPPLPPGPPPSASTPKLAPIPVARTLLPNGTMQQQLPQQMLQQTDQQLQQLQPTQQMPVQHTQHQYQQAPPMPNQIAQQNAQQPTQQIPQQQTQQYPQMNIQQIPYPQVSYLQGQMMPRPHGQEPQGPQVPYQLRQQPRDTQFPFQQVQQIQGPNVTHQHGQRPHESQFMQSQGQQSPAMQLMHQQGQQPQVPRSVHQQGQHPQGQQSASQQEQQIGFPRVEDSGRQEGRQPDFSFPLVQQTSVLPSSHHHLQGASHGAQISQVGAPSSQPHEHLSGPSSVSMQQAGTIQLQQPEIDRSYRQRQLGSPIVSNRIGHSMVRPMGLKMGYEEDQRERLGHEIHSSSRIEGPVLPPQQPKLGALPVARNQLDMRMGPVNPQFIAPGYSGGFEMVPEHALPKIYNHAALPNAAPMRSSPRMLGSSDNSPNAAPMRPSPRMLGSSNSTHFSAADAYRQHHEVNAMGGNVPAPFMTFEATGFPPEILKEMHLSGFSSPTPIQAQTWPVALQSRDIVAIAKTGSGKTLGYLIPAFIHLRRCRNNPQFGPTVLVLAPTRELATQIQEEAIKFGRSSRVSCTCLYGGAPKGPQLKEIERGADIVVATPGRLNDILEMKKINFRQVSLLVLDEADRMLDMGFEPQIRTIVNEIPPRRQTLMYTATWPKEVRKIAGDLLVNPVQVNIGNVDELAANKSITQYVELVSPMDKQRRLEQILRTQERGSKIIIFCSTKRMCDQLARSVGRSFGAAAIHGDKAQGERDHVLNQFRSGKVPILVATDVAARGLDIKDIRVVINYDFPTGVEDYVHRIGRTGRAGATGVAYTFFSDQDWKYASDLVKVLEGANQHVPPEVREIAGRGGPGFPRARGAGMNRWDSGGGGRGDSPGGRGMRDGGGYGGRGVRNDFVGGRGGRGRGFGRPGGPGGWGRHDRSPHDRYNSPDGRFRYDDRRRFGDRNRDRSYSRSPERVRSRGYDRSRSRSRSWSGSSSRSRSCSYDRPERRNFSRTPAAVDAEAGRRKPRAVSGFDVPPSGEMLQMLPGQGNGSILRNELGDELPDPDAERPGFPEPGTVLEPAAQHQEPEL